MNNLRLVSTRFIPQLGKTSISNFGRIPSLILRQYSQSSSVFGFEEFYDVPLKKNEVFVVGREWTVADLRRKSFEDLHKLWYILYKERNLLLTAKHERASFSQREPTLEENRYRRVKLSMANIKRVIEERKKIDKFFKQQEEKNSQSTSTTNTTSTKEDTTN